MQFTLFGRQWSSGTHADASLMVTDLSSKVMIRIVKRRRAIGQVLRRHERNDILKIICSTMSNLKLVMQPYLEFDVPPRNGGALHLVISGKDDNHYPRAMGSNAALTFSTRKTEVIEFTAGMNATRMRACIEDIDGGVYRSRWISMKSLTAKHADADQLMAQ